MSTCAYCGKESDGTAAQCRECGTELPEPPQDARAVEAQKAEDVRHMLKAFFIVLLVVSVVFPVYTSMTYVRDFAHNQWKARSKRVEDPVREQPPSAHFGLTAPQLADLDEVVASAYKDAVYDGYRLGNGYEKLWFQALVVDGLLVAASIIGLVHCKSVGRAANQNQ